MIRTSITLITLLCSSLSVLANNSAKQQVDKYLTANQTTANEMALKIAEIAELGYQEENSSKLLQGYLKQNDFNVEAGLADMPTSFIGSYGSGKPVIGFIVEYDALPGFSQAPTPHRESMEGTHTGHACGHHLLGVGAIESAIAVKKWMQEQGVEGTLKVFGSPAEEGGGGKVYLTRAGLVDDVDVMLNWHPASFNSSRSIRTLANFSGKFRFYGKSAHAAAAPENGRSALDGVEALNFMVNAMREHVEQKTRIHYVITQGGNAPNVVPDFAEVYYYARHTSPVVAKEVWQRIEKAAQGAAMGTGTRVDIEITNATFPMLPNRTLSELVHNNLTLVGGVDYTAQERKFAKQLQPTLAGEKVPLSRAATIDSFNFDNDEVYSVSSDVGDVSWNTPTNWLNAATWVPGTPPHSWQAVAAGTMSIGLKGMQVAAKTMAFSAVDLISQPQLLDKITEEFHKNRGDNFKYEPLVRDRKPPLDYRR